MIVRPHAIVLDAEAMSALANLDRRMQAWATAARRTNSTLHASTLTVAEVTDGTARDVRVRRAARSVRLEPVSESIAYRAGELRARAAAGRRKARDLTVDAVVAATALTLPAPVVVITGDPAGLGRLLHGTDVRVAPLTAG